MPLHYREEQLGVLAVANQVEGKPFSKSDSELIQSVADQAAYSLQHAKIYSQLTEKKKLDHDIEVAREIQRILLPSEAPEIGGFNCAAMNIPAQQVSGDYFDFIPVDETRWGRGRGRCQRKGRAGLDHHGHVPQRPAQQGAGASFRRRRVLREVNRLLYPDIREDMFITMIYMVMDPNGKLTAGAGRARVGALVPGPFQAHRERGSPPAWPSELMRAMSLTKSSRMLL